MTDPSVRARDKASDSVTLLLEDFVKQGEYFRSTKTFPGTPAPSDVLLKFRFPEYHSLRRLYPAYVPAALVTLTFYIWFGGPILVEDVDYAGTLTVRRPDGEVVTEVRASRTRKGTLNLYSKNYLNPDATPDRDAVIKELMDGAVTALAAGDGK